MLWFVLEDIRKVAQFILFVALVFLLIIFALIFIPLYWSYSNLQKVKLNNDKHLTQ